MQGSSLGLYFSPRGAGSTPARDKAFLSYPFVLLLRLRVLWKRLLCLLVIIPISRASTRHEQRTKSKEIQFGVPIQSVKA